MDRFLLFKSAVSSPRRWPAVAVLVASLAAPGFGCSPKDGGTTAPSARGSQVTIDNVVTIRFTGRMKELPFDPQDVRLREASQQVAALAGHNVEIVVDKALMPEYEYAFQDELIASLESLAVDLRKNADCDCKEWFPKTVVVNYDAAADEKTPYRRGELDTRTRTLTIPVGPRHGFIPDGVLDFILEDTRGDYLVDRYAGKEPAAVPTTDHREYFDYLKGSWTDIQTGERRAEKDADALRKALGIYERTRDAKLRHDIAEFASKEASSTFRYAYARGEMTADNREGDLPRAAKAMGSFVAKHERALSSEQRLRVAESIFVMDENRKSVPQALPGLDTFAFGMRVVDQWIKRGTTYEGLNDEDRKLIGFVVCHHPPNSGDGLCRDEAFYKWSWGAPGGKKKLASALMRRGKLAFVEAALYALDEPVELLRLLERDAKTWRMGARVVGDEYVTRTTDWVEDEVERLWRSRPADRWALLYMLARKDPNGYDDETWAEFRKRYGSLVNAREFSGFLRISPKAWESMSGVLRALAPGVPRGSIFAANMDSYLDAVDGRGEYTTSLTIAGELCKNGTAADRSKMLSYWTKRVRNHASERKVLSVAMERMKPKGCGE